MFTPFCRTRRQKLLILLVFFRPTFCPTFFLFSHLSDTSPKAFDIVGFFSSDILGHFVGHFWFVRQIKDRANFKLFNNFIVLVPFLAFFRDPTNPSNFVKKNAFFCILSKWQFDRLHVFLQISEQFLDIVFFILAFSMFRFCCHFYLISCFLYIILSDIFWPFFKNNTPQENNLDIIFCAFWSHH